MTQRELPDALEPLVAVLNERFDNAFSAISLLRDEHRADFGTLRTEAVENRQALQSGLDTLLLRMTGLEGREAERNGQIRRLVEDATSNERWHLDHEKWTKEHDTQIEMRVKDLEGAVFWRALGMQWKGLVSLFGLVGTTVAITVGLRSLGIFG